MRHAVWVATASIIAACVGTLTTFPAPVTAQAERRIIPLPSADFEAEYKLSGDMSGAMRFVFSRELQRMRVEFSAQGQSMVGVHDLKARSSRMWSAAMPGMIMRVDGGTKAEPKGAPTPETREILGERCAVWKTEGGSACFASDGTPLAFSGGAMKAEAARIDRKPVAPAAFAVPKGQELPIKLGAGMQMPLPF